MSISHRSGARDLQRLPSLKHYNYKNGKVYSLWASTLPKLRVTSKNASTKSCWTLNSIQKSQWVHAYISSPSPTGAMGLCTEFNAQQLLFEAFFHIMRIFGSVETQTESTFPLQYNIIFETYQSLEVLSSTLEEGRHVHPLTFLYRNQRSTIFIGTIFGYNAIFCSVKPSSESTFPFFYIIISQAHQSLEPPSSTVGGGEVDICAPDFFVGNLILNNFYLKLFSK